MNILIVLFLSATVLWLIYWAIIRRSIIDSVEDELGTLRDKVYWNIIDGAAGAQSKAASVLADDLELNECSFYISFSVIALGAFKNRSKMRAEFARQKELFDSSPKWIQDANNDNTRLLIKAALANSPTWWVPIAIILFGAVFSKKAMNWWDDIQNFISLSRSINHHGIGQPI
jgi:hypothetical protein